MCGIAGIIHVAGKQVSSQEIESLRQSIAHRGPDGSGIWIDSTNRLALIHTRLSILDLSDNAKQPMVSIDGRYVITFNGEIYNFIELKTELHSRGYVFKTQSDTEVILAAFDCWGIDCLKRFNGMWAFALYDTHKQKLLLARDRFGVKPLYYYKTDQTISFASETIAFKYLLQRKRTINEHNIKLVLQNTFALEGNGETVFENIYQLYPGHYVEIDTTLQFSQYRWWQTLDNLVSIPQTYSDQVAVLKDIFADACKIRLRSDVPCATALSGGVDSSSIYCMLHNLHAQNESTERMSSDHLRAFIASFPNTVLDEKVYADQVLAHTKGQGTIVYPDYNNLISSIESSTIAFDSIYLTPLFIVSDIYKQMRANGYVVSLDGHGVDEMLFGYPGMLMPIMDKLHGLQKMTDFESVKSTYLDMFTIGQKEQIKLISKRYKKIYIQDKIRWKLNYYANKLYRPNHNKVHQWIDGDVSYQNISRYQNESLRHYQLVDSDQIVYDNFHNSTLPTILRNFDRAAMQNGVEIRMPFMDYRLTSFVFSLPFESKVGNGFTKRILRDAMTGILPDSIRTRKQKIGLNAPMIEWFSNDLAEYILDNIRSVDFLNSSIWNGSVIANFAEEKIKRKSWTWADCTRFWPYLNAYILTKNN